MDAIKLHIDKDGEDESTSHTQKVTVPVDPVAWRKLKVYSAHHELKLTEKAGEIIKEWVDINVPA